MKWFDIFRHHGKKIRHGLIGMGVAILLLATPVPFTPAMWTDAFALETSQQTKVMALYLYNFLLFVEWPAKTIQENGNLCVNILGNDALFESLKPMNGKPVKGKKLTVKRLLKQQDIKESCQVLFIDPSNKALVPGILKRLRNQPVLTISNMTEFTDMGGMVLFNDLSNTLIEGKQPTRFKINLNAVEKAGLKIGSRLLRLSTIVKEAGDR